MRHHDRHDEIIATVTRLFPSAEVRVFDGSLPYPCDCAVSVGGPDGWYTVAAATTAGWAKMERCVAAYGHTMASAYSLEFNRMVTVLARRHEPPGAVRDALTTFLETNDMLYAAVAAIVAR